MSIHQLLERQNKLLEASYALHTSLDLDELLKLILKTASEGVDAERGTVFLVDREKNELWSKVLSGDETLVIRLPIGAGIAGKVAASGEAVRIDEAYLHPDFDWSWDDKSGFRTKHILCAPIVNRGGEVVGVFQLLNKRDGVFNQEDEDFLSALSIHAALAVDNAQLYTASLEKERYDREVMLAQRVQRRLQPEHRQEVLGEFCVAGMNEICEDASGDYYDMVMQLPNGQFAVVIGDASGHGLQAAFVMAEARAFLRVLLQAGGPLNKSLEKLNRLMVPDMDGEHYMTMFAAVIDPQSGSVEWVNAGHNPQLLYKAKTQEFVRLEHSSPILGFMADFEFACGTPVTFDPGDFLLLYTDGVTEMKNADGEMFEEERLKSVVKESVGIPPREMIGKLRSELHTWSPKQQESDDITLLVVCRAPEKASTPAE